MTIFVLGEATGRYLYFKYCEPVGDSSGSNIAGMPTLIKAPKSWNNSICKPKRSRVN